MTQISHQSSHESNKYIGNTNQNIKIIYSFNLQNIENTATVWPH